jgi:hypothetical protein
MQISYSEEDYAPQMYRFCQLRFFEKATLDAWKVSFVFTTHLPTCHDMPVCKLQGSLFDHFFLLGPDRDHFFTPSPRSRDHSP